MTDIDAVPWGLDFLDKNTLIITARSAALFLFNIETGKLSEIRGLPAVYVRGQGGLLDVARSPDYAQTGWIYFTYAKPVEGEGATTLARAKIVNHRLVQWQDLLVTKSTTETSHHFGSRITFDNDGHVYFGVGDRGERPNAQNRLNHAGSIMRLHLDGRVPGDNPFVNNPEVLDEIWSYGHRNPQGLFYDRATARLWEIEHGPRGGDEINLVESGKNYGWPVISYGKEYWAPLAVGEGTHRQGMEQPVKYYVPSIAPGSLIVYNGEMFSKWKGNLLAGALKLQHINRVELNNGKAVGEERLLTDFKRRIRDLVEGPAGDIYFSVDQGGVYRLSRN